MVQQVLGLLRVWTSPFTFLISFRKRYYALRVNWAQVTRSASSIYLEKFFFFLALVIHCNAYLLLESNPGKHLLFLHSRTVLRLPWALLSREKETKSPARKCASESLRRNGILSRPLYTRLFLTPLPLAYQRASSLGRSGSKPGSASCLHAGPLRANQGRIELWWPGTDSKGKRVKIMAHICVIRFQWSKWLSEREFDMKLMFFEPLRLIMNSNWKHLCLMLPLTVFIWP